MLPQKTGWRVKNLISWKNNELDNEHRTSVELFGANKFESFNAKRVSWTTQGPTTKTKIEFPLLRRTSSNATTETRHPPPFNNSTHSSARSLCSCECDANSALGRSLSAFEVRPPLRDALYSPPSISRKGSEVLRPRRLGFKDQRSSVPSLTKLDTNLSSTATTALPSPGSQLDLLEALTINLIDEDKTPTQSTRQLPILENVTDTVEKLIREADRAFREVGAALADAKAATNAWYDSESKSVVQNLTTSRGVLRKPPRVAPSIARSTSGPKLKRTKSTKKKKTILGKNFDQAARPPADTLSRWTLNDVTTNVVGVFRGKRITADEMMNKEMLQQLRTELSSRSESRASMESTQTIDINASTPTDPFHLENLPERLAAAQKKAAIPPTLSGPPPRIPETTEEKAKMPIVDKGKQIDMTIDDLTFPTPPQQRRPTTSRARSAPMPTILEGSAAAPITARTYTLLPSTKFTLNSPLFQQGSIRVERMMRELEVRPDDSSFDWTAFQLAISGTMDGEANSDDGEADLVGLEDIGEWWSSFGFEGYGKMEIGWVPSPLRRWKTSTISPPLASTTRGTNMRTVSLPARALKPFSSSCIPVLSPEGDPRSDSNTWKIANTEPRRLFAFPSSIQKRGSVAESLPPSPMLDLVVPSWSRDIAADIVPMNFSLSHDLADFLRWEANHVQTFVDD